MGRLVVAVVGAAPVLKQWRSLRGTPEPATCRSQDGSVIISSPMKMKRYGFA